MKLIEAVLCAIMITGFGLVFTGCLYRLQSNERIVDGARENLKNNEFVYESFRCLCIELENSEKQLDMNLWNEKCMEWKSGCEALCNVHIISMDNKRDFFTVSWICGNQEFSAKVTKKAE